MTIKAPLTFECRLNYHNRNVKRSNTKIQNVFYNSKPYTKKDVTIFSLCSVDIVSVDQHIKAIGKRIEHLRISLNQTRKQVATMVGISEGTLFNIETGKGITLNNLLALAVFFALEPTDLIDLEKELPDPLALRELMETYHNKRHKDVITLLQAPTQLKWCLTQLLTSGFFKEGKRVKEISAELKAQFKAQFSSSSISNSLANFVSNHQLKRRQEGAKNYLYEEG